MEHDENESWWLAEDVKGQVGYVPAAYLMIILDETQQEEESRKEGHDKRTDGTKIGGEMGQDGERRKSYSAAVIDKGVTMHRCIDASRYLGRRYVYRIVTQVSRY